MADRIVVMNKGYVQQVGTPLEIYDHPSNVFVATFIGSPAMNIVKAQLIDDRIILSDKEELILSSEQKGITKKYYQDLISSLETKIQALKDDNKEENIDSNEKKITRMEEEISKYKDYLSGKEIDIIFGIRPEDIIPSKRGDEYPEASKEFEARVSMAELLGCEYYLHFRTDSATLTSKVPLSKDLYKKDDSFFYRINLAKMHIFNAISEEAIF